MSQKENQPIETVGNAQKWATSALVQDYQANQRQGKFEVCNGPKTTFAAVITNNADGAIIERAAASKTVATLITNEAKVSVTSGDLDLTKTQVIFDSASQAIHESENEAHIATESHSILSKEETIVGLDCLNMASTVVNMASEKETAITAQNEGITVAAKKGDVTVTTGHGNLAIVAQARVPAITGGPAPAATPNVETAAQTIVNITEELLAGNVAISATSPFPMGGVAAIKSNTSSVAAKFASEMTGGLEVVVSTYASAVRMFNAFTFIGQPVGAVSTENAIEVPDLNLPSFSDLAKGLEDCLPKKVQEATKDFEKALPNTINNAANDIAGVDPDAAQGAAPSTARTENTGGFIIPETAGEKNSEETPVTEDSQKEGLPAVLTAGPNGSTEQKGKVEQVILGMGITGARALNVWPPTEETPPESLEETAPDLPEQQLEQLTKTIVDITKNVLDETGGTGGVDGPDDLFSGLMMSLVGAPNIEQILKDGSGVETLLTLPQNQGMAVDDLNRIRTLLRDSATREKAAKILAAVNAQLAIGFFGAISGALSGITQHLGMAMNVIQTFSSISGLGGLGGLNNILGAGGGMLQNFGGLEGIMGAIQGGDFNQILGMFGGQGQLGQLVSLGQTLASGLSQGSGPMDILQGLIQNQLGGILPAGVDLGSVMGLVNGLQVGRPFDATQLLSQLGSILPGGMGDAMGVFQQMQPILTAISSGDFTSMLGAGGLGGLMSGNFDLSGMLGGLSPELGGILEKLMPLMGSGQILTQIPQLLDLMNAQGLPILEQVSALLSCAALLNALRGMLEGLLEDEAYLSPETERTLGNTDIAGRIPRFVESLPRLIQIINEAQEIDRVLSVSDFISVAVSSTYIRVGQPVTVTVDVRRDGVGLQTPFILQISGRTPTRPTTNSSGRHTFQLLSSTPSEITIRAQTLSNKVSETRVRFFWESPTEYPQPIPDQPPTTDLPNPVPEIPDAPEDPSVPSPPPVIVLPPNIEINPPSWPAPDQPAIRTIEMRSNRSNLLVDERALVTVVTRFNGEAASMPFRLFLDEEEYERATAVDGTFQFEVRSDFARTRRLRAQLLSGQSVELNVTFFSERSEIPPEVLPEIDIRERLLRWVRDITLPLEPDSCLRLPKLKASEATVQVLSLSRGVLTFSLKASLPIVLLPQIGGTVSLRAFDFYTENGILKTVANESLFSPSVINFVIVDFSPATRVGRAILTQSSPFYLQGVDGIIYQYDPRSLGRNISPEIEDAYLV